MKRVIKLTESDITRIVKRIIKEEKLSKQDLLKKYLLKYGWKDITERVGGFDNLIKLAFNGEIGEFYKFMNWVPYEFTNDGRMLIDEVLIDLLNLPIRKDHWSGTERILGEFKYTTIKGEFTFKDRVDGPLHMSDSDQRFMYVKGMSDERKGFGYTDLYKKEILTDKIKNQIYQQIIDKYHLDNYL